MGMEADQKILTVEKKKIIIIDYYLPMFDRSSVSRGIFEITKIFKKLGYDVTFLTIFGEMEEKYRPILNDMDIEVICGDKAAMDVMGSMTIGGNLIDYALFFHKERFDYAIIESWNVAEYYIPIMRRYSPWTYIITDSVDVHFIREEKKRQNKQNIDSGDFARKKLDELRVYANSDMVWVVTEKDKRILNEYNIVDRPVEIIPYIYNKVVANNKYEDTEGLLFVGNFNHRPNEDAIIYFMNEIFPLIIEQIPDMKLVIAGNNPPESIKGFDSDNVTVTGFVKDLSPYLLGARISINPLRYGAGMKGKIGEALSWGLPVITTSIGAEGMGLIHEEHALIADTPHDFAKEVIRLYKDRKLWEKLSKNGKDKIESSLTPEIMEEKIHSIFSMLDETKDRQTGRYLIKSYPAIDLKNDLVSIIILSKDKWEYTNVCLRSVIKYSDMNFEIVFVDNGSEKPLLRLIKEWKERHGNIPVTYLRLEKNMGFAAGCNSAACISRGNYLVFLNNDTIVTPKWLSRLIAPLKADSRVAVTGPVSNYVNGRQWLKDCPIDFKKVQDVDLIKLEGFAETIIERFDNHYINTEFITGLCMAMKRELFERYGGFDEVFYPGNFEDADLSMRFKLTGYDLYVCKGIFVYHFGNVTFNTITDGHRENYNKNLKRFLKKWNINHFVSELDTFTEILNKKYEDNSFFILDNVRLSAPFIRPVVSHGIDRALDFYLEHLYCSGNPLFIGDNSMGGEAIYKRLCERYGEEELNGKGEIILFEGLFKDLMDELKDKDKYLLYQWEEDIPDEYSETCKMIVV